MNIKEFMDRAWEIQGRIEEWFRRLSKGSYAKVLKMARKPTPEEYKKTLLITGIGMILIGLLGFAIYLLWVYGGDVVVKIFGL